MSSAAIHLVNRNPAANRRLRLPEARRNPPGSLRCPLRRLDFDYAGLSLSTTPLSDPVQILQQMPAQAITHALLELLDHLSSPILLIENNPTGEWREPAALRLTALAV